LLFSQKIIYLEIKFIFTIGNSQKFKELILGTLGTLGTLSTLKKANHNRVITNNTLCEEYKLKNQTKKITSQMKMNRISHKGTKQHKVFLRELCVLVGLKS
jgi:hypothetical protein